MTKVIDLRLSSGSGGLAKWRFIEVYSNGLVDDQLETDYNACNSMSTGLTLGCPLSVALLPAPSAEPSESQCLP